ncbi:MAG: hypothetical protein ACOYM3_29240 [Terrimicrobiaceae bacterium]
MDCKSLLRVVHLSDAESKAQHLSYRHRLICVAFAQLPYRKSLRH